MSLSAVWDWKVEPESPGLFDLDPAEDVWLFDDHDVVKQVDVVIEDDEEDEKLGQPTTRSEVAAKLLDDLDEWIKEEPFNDWLEEKIDLPIFEDLPPLDHRSKYKSLDTQTLLQEFEHVFMEFNNGALTPPQSPPLAPPYHPEPVFHQLEKKDAMCYAQLMSREDIPEKMTYSIGSDGELVLLQTLQPDLVAMETTSVLPQQSDLVAMETTSVLDELVRSRAADIDNWEVSSSSSSSSSSASPPRSESDYVLSPPESGSDNSNLCVEVSEDPEWVPVSVNPQPKRKRGKPYARPVQDKKLRKKEQNKNAATRYRQKKKQEVDVILGEEKGLLDRNTELHKNVDELAREIKYLKGLMRDLFKAKGLLK